MDNMKLTLVLLFCVTLVVASPMSARRRAGRIVGGEESTPHSHPSIVSIQVSSHYCGGTIVNPNYIVTAAHCATLQPEQYTVVAGEHDLYTSDGVEQRRQVIKVVQHPEYNSVTSRNDIAIFQVDPPFEFNENVTAGTMARTGFEPAAVLTTVGWGTTQEGGQIPDRLQEVNVPFVTNAKCQNSYALIAIIYASQICAGEEGKDSCQGDSGGPLNSVDSDGNSVLVGITSFGVGCARPKFPGVYSRVSHFYEWIQQETGQLNIQVKTR